MVPFIIRDIIISGAGAPEPEIIDGRHVIVAERNLA
jgi:hypothetical protein